jgi:hypothetical protein
LALRPDSDSPWELRHDHADAPRELRYDRGAILSSKRRPDGTLLVEGVAARAGIYTYRRADGSFRRELVRASMLERTAKGLGRTGVTLHHPDPKKHPKGVTPKNAKELLVGDTDGDVRVEEGGFVRVWLAVRHQDALDAIDAGTQELSPGYAVVLGPGGEDPEFGPYDAEQLDRDYNHLAIVDSARGGEDVRLHLDGDAAVCTETFTGATSSARTPGGNPGSTTPTAIGGPLKLSPLVAQLVAQYGLGAQRFDSDESALSAILAEQQRRDAAAKDAEKQRADSATEAERAHKAAIQKLEGERDAEKRRADTAESDLKKAREQVQARADAEARKGLEKLAKRYRVDAAQYPEIPALKRAIAKAYNGGKLREDASDDYVAGMLEGAERELARSRDDDDDDDEYRDDDDRPGAGRRAGREAWQAGQRDDDDQDDDDDRQSRDDRDEPPRRRRDEGGRLGRRGSRPLSPTQASLARYDAAARDLERDGGDS